MTMLGLTDWSQEHSRIIVQDHLTSQNNVILNLAKSKAGSLEYEQPGYFYDGEVGVRKDEHSNHIAIRCNKNMEKTV